MSMTTLAQKVRLQIALEDKFTVTLDRPGALVFLHELEKIENGLYTIQQLETVATNSINLVRATAAIHEKTAEAKADRRVMLAVIGCSATLLAQNLLWWLL